MADWTKEPTKLQLKLRDHLYLPKSKIKFDINANTKIMRHVFNDNDFKIKKLKYKECKIKQCTKDVLEKRLVTSIAKIKKKGSSKKVISQKIKCARTKFAKKIENLENVLRAYKVRLVLSKEQEKIIFGWFDRCDFVYNSCVQKFNTDSKKYYSLSKSELFKEIFNGQAKDCPYDILTDEYKTFNANTKSALKNLKNGNIVKFEMKPKNTRRHRTIMIPRTAIKQDGFYLNTLGKIENFNKIVDIDLIKCDCKLTYEKLTKNFYFYISQYVKKKNINGRKEVVAIDEGECVFLTFYSPEECGMAGADMRKPLLEIQSRIKRLQSIIGQGKNKKGKKLRNKRSLHRKIGVSYKKITHIVDEVHHNAARYLCKKYKRILVPKFETKKMVLKNNGKDRKEKRRKNRLNKRVKFVLLSQAHYKFKQHLISKGEEYGCEIIECEEHYTSMCCGKCFHTSKKYNGRIKTCDSCGYKVNRDINGARNILIKNASLVIEN